MIDGRPVRGSARWIKGKKDSWRSGRCLGDEEATVPMAASREEVFQRGLL